MKKVLDRIWEWMKSTAWFQVVLLVGVLVAIVLCISPITKGISNAISDNKRAKYIEDNKINFDELISKVDNIEKSQEEFAVLFCDPFLDSAKNLDAGIQKYESDTEGAVKIYVVNTSITEANHGSYDMDENYYEFYKLDTAMSNFLYEGSKDVYNIWKDFCDNSTFELTQSSDYGSSVPQPTLMWFRTNDHIDSEFKDDDGNVITTLYDATKASEKRNINFHVAKVYTSIQYTEDSNKTTDSDKTLAGLQRFFTTSKFTD